MKRQLKTLKGKRVVLTNNANEITRNEIGIIEKQDGTLEVKEHDANGNIENIAGGSSEVLYYKSNKVALGGHIEPAFFCLIFGTAYSQETNNYYEDIVAPIQFAYNMASTDSITVYAGSFEPFLINGTKIESLEMIFELTGSTLEQNNLVRITKEEFYNLKGSDFRP